MELKTKGDSFNALVSQISSDERNELLENINKNSGKNKNTSSKENIKSKTESLKLRLKKESLFYKFYVWLRSFFQKKPQEEIYNEDLINSIAKQIDHEMPGLINHKSSILDTLFYEKLKNLKKASDFFKPYFLRVEENLGEFYIYLGKYVAPNIETKINSEADPFTLTFDTIPSQEIKNSLQKKLENILRDIDTNDKNQLYNATFNVNWLNKFTHLPFIHFISQFTNITGTNYSCPYRNSKEDFNFFASILTNKIIIENEILESIFVFSQKNMITEKTQQKDIDNSVREFISQAETHLNSIRLFSSSVPLNKLGRVINNDYEWQTQNIEGVDLWFQTYKNQWKLNFESRWRLWILERKKNTLSLTLRRDFELDSFPTLKFKPWLSVSQNVFFSQELTSGFVSWFSEDLFETISDILNDIMMEGVFIRQQDRLEYTEGLSLVKNSVEKMKSCNLRLSKEGDFGALFDDFIGRNNLTHQMQNQLDSAMAYIESEIREIVRDMKKGLEMLNNIFIGILNEPVDGLIAGLQNFKTIKGHKNREWREQVVKVRSIVKHSLMFITQLEALENELKEY